MLKTNPPSELYRLSEIVSRIARVPIQDFEAGLLDQGVKSIQMVAIVGQIENAYGIEFEEMDLTRENFASIRSIFDTVSNCLNRE